MKIKRITLYNIGPYLDVNSFDFTASKDRNIVLIGGKNGAGKTTFFKAIKTCLYGCKVWGFDASGKEYYSIINGLVNSKSLYDSSACAYVEIELLFDDGKQINNYVLHREWRKVKMNLSEYFNIRKNDELIIGGDEDDFINYLLSIIPPDMFNFYFFDGESIAEFFLGADGNKNFRNAFLKLYGLDTLSIMIENFNRNVKRVDAKKTSYDSYVAAKELVERQSNLIDAIKSELKADDERIDYLQIKLRSLQSEYTKEGGVGLAEWKEINSSMLKEENVRDNINRWFKEVANHYLPFVILENNLRKLLEELTLAQDAQKNDLLFQTLSGEEFRSSLKHFFVQQNVDKINLDELILYIKESMKTQKQFIDFDFSVNQISRIMAQIYEKLSFDKDQIRKATSQLNTSLRKSKKLRDQLTASSIDGYEAFVGEKEHIEKEISALVLQMEKKKSELEKQLALLDSLQKDFSKAKESYEAALKNRSITDISERAAATYALLEEKLVRRQAMLLQKEFVNCFNAIINKNNFIDGIVVDKNINVIPYKYISVNKAQLDNYKKINRDFLTFFDSVKIIMDMNKLEFGEVDSILLPSPIQVPFSQGERQVYIMSIYLALLKTSHKDIPFFIDTPFARIDSNHRASIVSEFFTKVKNQMFILSTDEEIVGEYKNMMRSKISDTFILQISNYGRTKIIANDYFGE